MTWQTKNLGEVCAYINRGVSPKYVEKGGVVVLNQKCIRNHEISYTEAKKHNDTLKGFADEKLIQVGDVLVNSTGVGTLGRVAQVKSVKVPTLVDSHITIVRPIKALFDRNFFGWAMIFVEDLIKQMGAGASGQTELSRTTLKEIEITYPESLLEQKRIVAILDEVFEGIAKAKQNAEKNLKNAREVFEETLNKIFSSTNYWETCELNKYIKFIDYRGKTPQKTTSGLRLITAKNVKKGYLQTTPEEFVHPNTYKSWMTRGIPQKGDILFTTEAPLANVAQLDTDEKVVFAQRIIVFHPDPSVFDNSFVKFMLLSKPVQKKIIEKGSGATVQGIKAKLLKKIDISFPKSLLEQKSIVAQLDTLSQQTKKLEQIYQRKLELLDELKQSVLQKAFAGEI